MERLYGNIGGKIKILAFVGFIVESVASVITGIVFMADDITFFIGLPILLFGPVVAFIGSWILYAFGQLVENSDIIAESACEYSEKANREDSHSSEHFRDNTVHNPASNHRICPKCDTANPLSSIFCQNCGESLKYASRSFTQQQPVKQEKSKKCACGTRYYGDTCPVCGRSGE